MREKRRGARVVPVAQSSGARNASSGGGVLVRARETECNAVVRPGASITLVRIWLLKTG
jgi:hypothetical protein